MQYPDLFSPIAMVDDQVKQLTADGDTSQSSTAAELNEAASSIEDMYKEQYGESARSPFNNVVEQAEEEEKEEQSSEEDQDDSLDAGKDEDNSEADNDTEAPEGADTDSLKMIDGGAMSFLALRRTPAWMRALFRYTPTMEYGDGTNTHANAYEAPGFEDAGDVVILDSEIGPAGESTEPGSTEYDKKRIESVSNGGAAVNNDNGGEEGGDEDMGDLGMDDGDLNFDSMHFMPGNNAIRDADANPTPVHMVLTPRFDRRGVVCTVSAIMPHLNDGLVEYSVRACRPIFFKAWPTNYKAMQTIINRSVHLGLTKSLRPSRNSQLLIKIRIDDRDIPKLLKEVESRVPNCSAKNWPQFNYEFPTYLYTGKNNLLTVSELWDSSYDLPVMNGPVFEIDSHLDDAYMSGFTVKSATHNQFITFRCDEVFDRDRHNNPSAYMTTHVAPVIDRILRTARCCFANTNFKYTVQGSVAINDQLHVDPMGAYRTFSDYIVNHGQHPELVDIMLQRLSNDMARMENDTSTTTMGGRWVALPTENNTQHFWNAVDTLRSDMSRDMRLHSALAEHGYCLEDTSQSYAIRTRHTPYHHEHAISGMITFNSTCDLFGACEDFMDDLMAVGNLAAKGVVGSFRLSVGIWKAIRNGIQRYLTSLHRLLKFWENKLSDIIDDIPDKAFGEVNANCLPYENWQKAYKAAYDGFFAVRNCEKLVFHDPSQLMNDKLTAIFNGFKEAGVELSPESADVKISELKSRVRHDSLNSLGFNKTVVRSIVSLLQETEKFMTSSGESELEKHIKNCESNIKSTIEKSDNPSEKAVAICGKRVGIISVISKASYVVVGLCIEGALSVMKSVEDAADKPETKLGDINPFRVDPRSYEAIRERISNL